MGVFENIQLATLERLTDRKYLKVKGQVEMYLGVCLKARGDLLESAKSGKAEYSLEEAKEAADKPIKSFQTDLDEMVGLKDMFVAGMESLRHHHIAKCIRPLFVNGFAIDTFDKFNKLDNRTRLWRANPKIPRVFPI